MDARIIAAALALGTATSASATIFTEIEPNDTAATAQSLVHNGTITLTGFRESSPTNDFNDFFSFEATAGDNIAFRVNALGGGDPLIQLRTGANDFLAENDDSGGGFNSLINFNILQTGTYLAAVRGFGNSVYNYELSITGLTPSGAIPEPASWALMIAGFGFVGSAMRRRTATVARVAA